MRTQVRKAAAGIGLAVAVGALGGWQQKPTTADVAARLTGTWKINRELSPSIAAPARGRGGPGGRPGYAIAPAAFQRGGGRGGGGLGGGAPTTSADLTPDELAAQAAMRQLQQIPEVITIKASPESVAFTDVRGERTYPVNDKNVKLEMNGTTVNVKTKWDKLALKQEFSTPQRRLVQSWEIDQNGRLVLKLRVESMTMSSTDARAVYDRQS